MKQSQYNIPRGHRFITNRSDAAMLIQHSAPSMTGPADLQGTPGTTQTRAHGLSDCATAWK